MPTRGHNRRVQPDVATYPINYTHLTLSSVFLLQKMRSKEQRPVLVRCAALRNFFVDSALDYTEMTTEVT